MANLKLKNPAGGSLNLVSADGASDLTATVPTRTGTFMLEPVSFLAQGAGTQTVSNSTETTVQFTNKQLDSNGCYDTGTSRFTPNVAGYYLLTTTVSTNGSSGETYAYIKRNTTGYLIYDQTPTSFWALNASVMIYANGTTDYFTVTFVQNYGSTRTFNTECRFSGFLVRPA